MSLNQPVLFYLACIAALMLAVAGLYCLLVTRNLIRALIGLEIIIKAVTLLIITVGFYSGQSAFAQAMVITLIVVEVVIMTVAVGVVIGIHRRCGSLDTHNIRNLKG